MSGAEVLAGIGILCNAMQILTFGKDALEVYNHVRENGTVDPRLETFLADASISYQGMRKQLSASGPLTSDQHEIVRIGEAAHNGLEKFKTYVAQLYVDENSRKGLFGRLRIAKSGIKTLFRSKELEDLENNFQRYQQLFQTRLIQRVCSQDDAAALLIQECFTNLNSTQQFMIKKIAEGHTEISLLASQKAAEVKDHVTNQHGETRTAMGNYLSVTENSLRSHISKSTSVIQQDMTSRHNTEDEIKKYDQLMASLRYPEMNTRKNQVVENFPKTFQWIFSKKSHEIGRVSKDQGYKEGQRDEESYKERHETPDSGRNQEERTRREFYHDDTTSTASRSEDSTEFTRWLGSEAKMFWISGKPGSGKSTLMKFISTNSATREQLAAWRSNVHILTHYFWKAGSPMERSLKGLLLSLAHQVLLDRVTLAQRLLEETPEVRHKWSHGDWSLQQLEDALFWVLKATGESFLLLIDGLDESEEFGRHLSTISRDKSILDKLIQVRNVKICVSSREEYIFSLHFEGVGRLRIHELTAHDIHEFASSRLEKTLFAHQNDRVCVLNLIVARAQGVFLWVALVVDSVTRAFRLDNSFQDLIERVERMPSRLIDLVRDMWERSGEDGDVPSYRASASRYFNLALVFYDIPILDLTLASEERSLEVLLDPSRVWDPVELAKICSRTEKKVSLVCHGLLEVIGSHDVGLPLSELLQQYDKIRARFIHRCAIDFLLDTEDGSALLNACGWRQVDALAWKIGVRLVSSFLTLPEGLIRLPVSPYFDKTFGKKRYTFQSGVVLNVMEDELREMDRNRFPASYQGFFLLKFYEWHMAERFRQYEVWGYSKHSVFREEPLKNEYVASLAKSASLSITNKLIEALPITEFLNTLPAIFRGLSKRLVHEGVFDDSGFPEEQFLQSIQMKNRDKGCSRVWRANLIERVLTRLLELQEIECSRDLLFKASTGETREDLQRLVCSWFLGSLDTNKYERCDDTVSKAELAALKVVKLALTYLEGWNQSVLLCLQPDKRGAQGFMHFDPSRSSHRLFVAVSFSTVYEIFLRFVRGSAATSQSTQGISITDEHIPDISNGADLSLRIVAIMDGRESFHTYRGECQRQDSEILLDSLLTGRCLTTEEIATLKERIGDPVAKGNIDLASYLISELGHIPGLPMHPWSAWFVFDVSGHNGDEGLYAQVNERSRETFRKVIEQISQEISQDL